MLAYVQKKRLYETDATIHNVLFSGSFLPCFRGSKMPVFGSAVLLDIINSRGSDRSGRIVNGWGGSQLIININIDYEYHCRYAGWLAIAYLVGKPIGRGYIIINIRMGVFGSEPNRSGSGRFWSVTSIGGRFASTGVAMDV